MRVAYLARRLSIPLLALALIGCGFRLAGTASLPAELAQIQLSTTGFDRRQRDALYQRLRRAGAEVSAAPSAGAVRLQVRLKVLPNRRLATSAGKGTFVERVSRGLDYSLQDAGGAPLVPLKSLLQQKDIVLDDDNLLSSSVEQDNVVRDLEAALFDQLLQQLERL